MLTLTTQALRELTGHSRSDAQRRELAHMGIPFRVRRDGSLAVLRSHVEFGGTIPQPQEPVLSMASY